MSSVLKELEEYARTHWKAVVLCKECRYGHLTKEGIRCDKVPVFEDTFVEPDWWCADGRETEGR